MRDEESRRSLCWDLGTLREVSSMLQQTNEKAMVASTAAKASMGRQILRAILRDRQKMIQSIVCYSTVTCHEGIQPSGA
jgi:hypothetical protein